MPSQRKSNAPKRKAPTSTHNQKPAAHQAVVAPSAWHDIAGVALIVLAVALLVALMSPSDALVAQAFRTGLVMGFGAGAPLVPCALLLYAITYFVPQDGPFSLRIALGLTLIVAALLAMLSVLATPDGLASANADMVFADAVAQTSGGWLGGAVAWVLLTLLGRTISLIVLVGLMIAGIVICGFSISGLVAKIRNASSAAHEHLAERASERATSRAQARAARAAAGEGTAVLAASPTTALPRRGRSKSGEPATTFLGNRKTSVLRRGDKAQKPYQHPRMAADEAPGALHDTVEDLEGQTVTAPLPVTPASHDKKRPQRRRRAKAQEAQDALVEDGDLLGNEEAADARDVDQWDGPDTPQLDLSAPWEEAPAAPKPKGAKDAKASAAEKPTAPSGGISKAAMAKAPAKPKRPGEDSAQYELPPLSLLDTSKDNSVTASSEEELQATADRLQAKLIEFGSTSQVVGWVAGPIVTTFKIQMGEGERVSKIMNLEDDIALSLAAKSVRIFVIPGSTYLGIEIPNSKRRNVYLGDVVPFAKGGALEFAIGRDSEGKPVVADLAKMPHLLIAGTTGSGKSVMINTIIMSMLMRATPDQLRLIMVDPKRVEFTFYEGLPHLYVPVVTEPKQAASALQWATTEMERRLKIFAKAGVRNIAGYNKKVKSGALGDDEGASPDPMPYLVVVVDELSDLMMVSGKEVEASIVRIAQLARAAGIHLVLATQRPTTDVVTGLIKANIESRIALTVAQKNDSRIILDEKGADRLLGNGDMLFKSGGLKPRRILGCYVSDDEVENVVSYWADQGEPDYHEEVLSAVAPAELEGSSEASDLDEEDDPLVWEAAQIVVDSQLGSTSTLQRRLKVGYARAGRIMDMLEHKGIVGPPNGSKPRDVLLQPEGLEELRQAEALYREV